MGGVMKREVLGMSALGMSEVDKRESVHGKEE